MRVPGRGPRFSVGSGYLERMTDFEMEGTHGPGEPPGRAAANRSRIRIRDDGRRAFRTAARDFGGWERKTLRPFAWRPCDRRCGLRYRRPLQRQPIASSLQDHCSRIAANHRAKRAVISSGIDLPPPAPSAVRRKRVVGQFERCGAGNPARSRLFSRLICRQLPP